MSNTKELKNCPYCGEKILKIAIKCKHCLSNLGTGEPEVIKTIQKPDRTESKVIQVAPDVENILINEMEQFGWSLHNRQEIYQEGDAYGRPSFLSTVGIENRYITTTKVQHYVKLHFTRSLSFPNLDKIKELEAKYNSIPSDPIIPEFNVGKHAAKYMLTLGFSAPVSVVQGLTFKKRKAEAEKILEEVRHKKDEILSQVIKLL